MIISRIWAGLGNQLFQYAAGKCLSLLLKTEFKIDTRWFGMRIPGDTPRRYELDLFHLEVEKATLKEIQKFPFTHIPRLKLGRSLLPRLHLFLQKKIPLSSYREIHFHFDPKFFDLPIDAYLIGYFQSEKYFKPIEDTLRKEFTFKIPPSRENGQLLEEMETRTGVSLHIRRGDYVSDPRVKRHHGLCDLDYYSRAIQEITNRVPDPHFYIFSDDPAWVKDNLKTNGTYISHNQGLKSYEDLRLMSHCRHHILANSSFSWWGAYLNPRADKIVIAPQKWTNAPLNFSDLLPSSWTTL